MQMYKVKDANTVFLYGFRTQFGGGKSSGFGLVYDSVNDAKRFEPKYRLIRVRLHWSGGDESDDVNGVLTLRRLSLLFPNTNSKAFRRRWRPRASRSRRPRTVARRSAVSAAASLATRPPRPTSRELRARLVRVRRWWWPPPPRAWCSHLFRALAESIWGFTEILAGE